MKKNEVAALLASMNLKATYHKGTLSTNPGFSLDAHENINIGTGKLLMISCQFAEGRFYMYWCNNEAEVRAAILRAIAGLPPL